MKTPGFCNNTDLHICSICLRLVLSSLTETIMQKFSICRLNRVEMEHIPMKVWCLKSFIYTDQTDEQSAFDGL